MHEVRLSGCTPEPLMNYLKALGVLHLVSEQVDPRTAVFWREGTAILQSPYTQEELVTFFENAYAPSPLIVPWGGTLFFGVNPDRAQEPQSKAPTKKAIIEAFLNNRSKRLDAFNEAIRHCVRLYDQLNIRSKADLEDKTLKARLISELRNTLPDPVLDWIDAAAQPSVEKVVFNQLLGSGGGTDGNLHFQDNFMQNLWDCLPDFDEQRKKPDAPKPSISHALFNSAAGKLVGRSGGLYDPASVEACNATQGFFRDKLINPWNFILGMEGLLVFTGGMAKRAGQHGSATAAFPFLVRMSAAGSEFGSTVQKEYSQYEIWLPLWERPTTYAEVNYFFREGKAQVNRRQAQTGVDMARAIVTRGTSAGIAAFQRYGLVRGRVGGDKYFTATSVGQYRAGFNTHVSLFDQLDPWLAAFARVQRDDKAPTRYAMQFRRLDRAIADYCRAGTPAGQQRPLTGLLEVLGATERTLASGIRFASDRRIRPLQGLTADWLAHADDGSVEFRIAAALAGIRGHERICGSLRTYLEPVEERGFAAWKPASTTAVWSQRPLAENLAAVFRRRQMEAYRGGLGSVPLFSPRRVTLGDVEAFLDGQTDDARITDLLWALIGVDWRDPASMMSPAEASPTASATSSAAYAAASGLPLPFSLLRLLVDPPALTPGKGRWQLDRSAQKPASGTEAFQALVSGRPDVVPAAVAAAVRRLKAQGFIPIGSRNRQGKSGELPLLTGVHPDRLCASMLLPLAATDLVSIANTVLYLPNSEE